MSLTLFQITYYQIFGDTFNLILLGLIYDDQSAMIDTAVNSSYNILKILIWFIITFILIKIYKYSHEKISSIDFGSKKQDVNFYAAYVIYYSPYVNINSYAAREQS